LRVKPLAQVDAVHRRSKHCHKCISGENKTVVFLVILFLKHAAQKENSWS